MVLKEKPSPFPGILQNTLYIKRTAGQNLSAVFSCGKRREPGVYLFFRA